MRKTATGSSRVSAPGGRRTLAALLDEWEKNQMTNGAESAARVMGNVKNHVLPRLRRGIVLVDIDAKMLCKWLSDLQESTSVPVTRNACNALSTIPSFAVKREYIESNPLRRVTKPARPTSKKVRSGRFIQRQAETYVGLVQDLRAAGDPAYYWVLTLGLGLRRSELCGLRWDALDLDVEIPTLTVLHVCAQTLIITSARERNPGARG